MNRTNPLMKCCTVYVYGLILSLKDLNEFVRAINGTCLDKRYAFIKQYAQTLYYHYFVPNGRSSHCIKHEGNILHLMYER